MRKASVDVGFGYVKAVLPDSDSKAVFPAALAPVDEGLGDTLGRRDTVRINGEPYLVGRAALDAGAQASWQTGEEGVRRDYPMLVGAALGKMGAPPGSLTLCVGLPLSSYATDRQALHDALRDQTLKVNDVLYHLAEVKVFPQGVGAYAAAMEDEPDLRYRPVGVIDIGYRTTDYLIIRHDDRRRAQPILWGTADIGGQSVASACGQILARQGVRVSLAQIERALETGQSLWLRGQEVPLPVDAARAQVAAAIANAVQHAWREEMDTLAAIIVTGGAGKALADYFPWPHVRVPKDPLFANARGYLLLAA
ncbi:MAG TPA: ParM/StbA family protein [Calditerricola sp.]